MDLDEDDITSSEGNKLIISLIRKTFVTFKIILGYSEQQQRQLGRRSQRLASDGKAIEEEDDDGSYPPPPDTPHAYSPTGAYSPTFSGIDRTSYGTNPPLSPNSSFSPNRPNTSNNARFYGEPSTSPPPTQTVGLPVKDGRSTEV